MANSTANSTETSILFVGIGMMGQPMVRLLANAGYQLTLLDADRARAQALAEDIGAQTTADASGVARDVDFVILMLPDSSAVESVLLPGEGPGLLKQLSPGAVVLDMGSSEPARTMTIAESAGAASVLFGDAPVSGGVARAITGELSIMFGGEESLLEQCRPILATLGTSIVRAGGVGSGHAVKALNNLLSAINIVAASEVLCVGTRFGLDANVMLEVLNHSTGRSQATEVKFPRHVVTRTFDSGFSLRLMLKDLRTALALAEGLDIATPLGDSAFAAFKGAETLITEGTPDHTEVVRFVEERSNARIAPQPEP